MTEVLFLHTGWARDYLGATDDKPVDKSGYIVGGGTDIAEALNWRSYDGVLYGYSATTKGTINIDKLGASKGAASIDDILIIWTTTKPGRGSARYIVGWWRGATVHRKLQARVLGRRRRNFVATADAARCHLLEPNERTHEVLCHQKGWPGQSNAFFAGTSMDASDLRKILGYVNKVSRSLPRQAAARSDDGEEVHDPARPPLSMEDARRRMERSIVVRQGGGPFRDAVVAAFGGRCAITGYDVTEGLEAAHIVPYRGAHTNEVTNGLLLRADLHTLLDRGLILIDAATFKVEVAPELRSSAVGDLHGRRLSLPRQSGRWREAFQHRRELLGG